MYCSKYKIPKFKFIWVKVVEIMNAQIWAIMVGTGSSLYWS